MKIVFTGGGTGGHFYPIIAVAQKVNQLIDEENILGAKLYFLSFKNFLDFFKILFGTINAVFKLFSIYPDVVFGKGGYGSFPTIFAARLLRIPTIIHESDSAPGRVNKWAGHFALKVAVSFKEAAEYFPKAKVAWTGQPIRTEIENPAPRSEALKYFKFESDLPTIVILGGSQGAELINNTVIDALPRLVKNYQIVHQTGVLNFKTVS